MTVIDINIDAGESYGAWRWATTPARSRTRPPSTSPAASTAATPQSMFAAARLALEHGLAIGAHPGLPDLVGFGRAPPARDARPGLRRRRLPGRRAQRRARRARRVHCTTSSCTGRSRRTRAEDPAVADSVVKARPRHRSDAAARRHAALAARARGASTSPTRSIAEGFPERGLRGRRPARQARPPGADITDVDEAARRAVRMAVDGVVDADRRHADHVPPAHALHPRRQPARRAHRRRRARRAGGCRGRAGGVLSGAPARRLRPPRRSDRSRGQRAAPAPRAAPARRPPRGRDRRPARLHDALRGVRRAPRGARRDRRLADGPPRGGAGGRRTTRAASFVRVPMQSTTARTCRPSARRPGLARHEVIDLHSGRDYRVFAVGASPGYPFLGVLDERLRMPRRPSPRAVVPAHAVAMTGLQTGIYPVPGPGAGSCSATRCAPSTTPGASSRS